ncbi:MAG: UDP-4-amino-4,6-dideoxy-N-acetyl-beta-L-altrosamine N-acetyltransferase [Lachnospiraceae bacterium]|nr:UDP-4-amino-4,6-dideoxy-N-acetyl-beta-L-altrosamine N-acetyltransferase [Lachnospiraceae bacterium]
MNNNKIVEGRTVYLRPMTEEDTDLIVKWRNEDFVRKNFIYQKPFTREGHLHWIETMVKTGKVVQFLICTREDIPIGSIYLRDIDRTFNNAEYGIFIGEETALSKGYGTEAAKLMISYAFGELKLHKLKLRVLADNERAKKSYEKAGFMQEAYLKDEVYLQGGYRDVILMALLNPENQEGVNSETD